MPDLLITRRIKMFYIKDMLDIKIDNNPEGIYLLKSDWDDFGYRTTFSVVIYRKKEGKEGYIDLGSIKIAFKDSSRFDFKDNGSKYRYAYVYDSLEKIFERLPDDYISLGQDLYYYKDFIENLGKEKLNLLNDVIINEQYFQLILENNDVFKQSLARFFSKEMYNQVVNFFDGKDIFEDSYGFTIFNYKNTDLGFSVATKSILPTNVHAIIGSNGVGKTRLLESIVKSYNNNIYKELNIETIDSDLKKHQFQHLVFATTSIFSELKPLSEEDSLEYGFNLIGFHPNKEEFISSIANAVLRCILKNRENIFKIYLENISINQSLRNVRNELCEILDKWYFNDEEDNIKAIKKAISHMSSGNMTIIYIIASIIHFVEQKTLILIDEPETHLHPTLLSSFISTINRVAKLYNAMIVIATHSPVVLQEIPSTCVWKIFDTKVERPIINTFGENVGIITRDVYGLESKNSGFIKFIQGRSMNELREIKKQLGSEALFEFLSKEGGKNE